ncbi:MAG: hypothetical protein GEU83_12035 [Pseudonocardiaceae bacterium]|nr:hypothetical protein [Pseudonocardiaceae bacterium]
MAHKTERNPFAPFLNGFSYDQAFDGATWELKRGEDFEQAPSTVARKLQEEFERRYGELQIKAEGDTITVRHVRGELAR